MLSRETGTLTVYKEACTVAVAEANRTTGRSFGRSVELWHDRNQRIDLGAANALLSDVCIWFGGLVNLLTQVTNSSFHGPLCIADRRPFLKSLWNKMNDLVHSRTNKVDAVVTKLVIKEFKVAFQTQRRA